MLVTGRVHGVQRAWSRSSALLFVLWESGTLSRMWSGHLGRSTCEAVQLGGAMPVREAAGIANAGVPDDVHVPARTLGRCRVQAVTVFVPVAWELGLYCAWEPDAAMQSSLCTNPPPALPCSHARAVPSRGPVYRNSICLRIRNKPLPFAPKVQQAISVKLVFMGLVVIDQEPLLPYFFCQRRPASARRGP